MSFCVWSLGRWGCIFLHLNCVSWGNIWKRPSRLSPFGHYSLVSVLPTCRTNRGRSLLPACVSLARPACTETRTAADLDICALGMGETSRQLFLGMVFGHCLCGSCSTKVCKGSELTLSHQEREKNVLSLCHLRNESVSVSLGSSAREMCSPGQQPGMAVQALAGLLQQLLRWAESTTVLIRDLLCEVIGMVALTLQPGERLWHGNLG